MSLLQGNKLPLPFLRYLLDLTTSSMLYCFTMTERRATLPVQVSRGTHDLVRRIAYEQRTTMRKVIEEAVWKMYGEKAGENKSK